MSHSVQRLLSQDVHSFGIDPKDIGKWAVVKFVEVVSVHNAIGEADDEAARLNGLQQ